jgi:hypothetical protein
VLAESIRCKLHSVTLNDSKLYYALDSNNFTESLICGC